MTEHPPRPVPPPTPHGYAPAPTAAPVTTELEYHQVLRGGREGGWRPLVGVLVLATSFLVVNSLVVLTGFAIYYAATGADIAAEVTALTDLDDVTPALLLFVNLTLVLAIPETWLVVRLLHGLRPGWLTSVVPRMRWGWFAISLGTAFVTLVVAIVLGTVLPTDVQGAEVAAEPNAFTPEIRDFLLIVVLLTPLQAAAEEYVFRGYLTQAFGGLLDDVWPARALAVIGPAALFAAAHGAQSFPVFVDRFTFGLAAGVLVIGTGGLEAAIAYHVLNNLIAFGLTLAYGDMTSALSPTGGTWIDVVVSIVKSLLFVGLSIGAARLLRLQTRTSGTGLAASVGRV